MEAVLWLLGQNCSRIFLCIFLTDIWISIVEVRQLYKKALSGKSFKAYLKKLFARYSDIENYLPDSTGLKCKIEAGFCPNTSISVLAFS